MEALGVDSESEKTNPCRVCHGGLDTFDARLRGAVEVTIGDGHTSTKITRPKKSGWQGAHCEAEREPSQMAHGKEACTAPGDTSRLFFASTTGLHSQLDIEVDPCSTCEMKRREVDGHERELERVC